MPHAIANRLAKECLKNIRDFRIRQIFEQKGAERLLESFSKRLSYLHESEEARGIAAHWLSENGLLSDLTDLNQLKINLLKRIAPVTPELVLSSIEKAANSGNHAHFFSDNYYRYGLAKILCKLAYKKELFTRSVKLLCIFAIADKTASRPYSIRALLLPLFPALRSGTHATAEQKLSVIAGLFHSGNEEQVKLAIELLRSTLRCLSLNSVGDSEFGGHWRDSGYEPKGQELNQWFLLFLEFAGNLAISDYAYALQVIVNGTILIPQFIPHPSLKPLYPLHIDLPQFQILILKVSVHFPGDGLQRSRSAKLLIVPKPIDLLPGHGKPTHRIQPQNLILYFLRVRLRRSQFHINHRPLRFRLLRGQEIIEPRGIRMILPNLRSLLIPLLRFQLHTQSIIPRFPILDYPNIKRSLTRFFVEFFLTK